MSVHSVFIPIYDTHCHVILNEKHVAKTLKRLHVAPDDIETYINDSYSAITFVNEKDEPIILFKKPMGRAETVGTIAHELFHAAHIILKDRGVRLRDKDDNESHCYLIGFLMEKVYETIYLDKGAKGK